MRYSIQKGTVQQVKATGGSGIKEAKKTNIIFADLTTEQVARLKAQGALVEKVGYVKAIVSPTITPPKPVAAEPKYSVKELLWVAGLEEIRQQYRPALYGEGFNVAVIGTGIRKTHKMINGRVIYEKNFTTDVMEDKFNHDTAVASIITTVTPLCNILNYKVLDGEGIGTEEAVVLALDDCIAMYDAREEMTPLVINLSLGTEDDGNPQSPMRVACRAAIERGIWIVAAAGNNGQKGPGTIMSPACEKYVFAVGSLSYEPFTISEFSGRGPSREGLTKPDIAAFGENIILASSASDTATIAKSGTSFSTPFMSAAAILYHEGWMRVKYIGEPFTGMWLGRFPELEELERPPDIDVIIDTYLEQVCAKPQGVVAGKDNTYGYGVLVGELLVRTLGFRPAVLDISTVLSSVTPLMVLGLLGMVMSSMAKAFR